MLRAARRLATVVSLAALLLTLTVWSRAQWTQDVITRQSVGGSPRTLRWSAMLLTTTRGSLCVGGRANRIELTTGPAAEAFRRDMLSDVGWRHSTMYPASLATALPDRATLLGFHLSLDPPRAETRCPAITPGPDPGWQTVRRRTGRLAIPWWFLALSFAALPAVAVRRYFRTRRSRTVPLAISRPLGILLNSAAALSLLLCLAAVILWVRSHLVSDEFQRFDFVDGRLRERRILSLNGAVAWGQDAYFTSFREGLRVGLWEPKQYPTGGPTDRDTPAVFFLHEPTTSQKAGFILHHAPRDDADWNAPFMPNAVVGLPYWALALALAILPAARTRQAVATLRARRRRAHGLCPTCGYDLRATPTRCPECGRDVPDSAHAGAAAGHPQRRSSRARK
jgi:hypothetical protein